MIEIIQRKSILTDGFKPKGVSSCFNLKDLN